MYEAGALDLRLPAGRIEALLILLQIALARNRDRGGSIEGLSNKIFDDLLGAQDFPNLESQLLYSILVADFAWTIREFPSGTGLRAAVNAAIRIASVAQQRDWVSIAADYYTAALSLIERIEPVPHDELADASWVLARTLGRLRQRDASIRLLRKAISHVDAFMADQEAQATDIEQAKRWRATKTTLLNDLGWSLLFDKRFSEAVAPLEAAYRERLADRTGRTLCEAGNREDTEFATVCQNLADTYLALGRFEEALDRARQARHCRSRFGDDLNHKWKVAESAKTEGYALIYTGQQEAGKKLLELYSASARRLMDYDALPADDHFISGAVVNGEFIPLDRVVQVSAKLHDAVMLPDASVWSPSVGVATQQSPTMSDLDAAIAREPTVTLFKRRGTSYLDQDDFGNAARDFTEAIKLDPADAESFALRATAHLGTGNAASCLRDLTQAIEIDPTHAPWYSVRAGLWVRAGDYSRAIDDFTQAIDRGKVDAEDFVGRGFALFKRNEFARAILDYDRAIELGPREAEAFGRRGVAHFCLGDFAKAVRDLSKAIELYPTNAESFGQRGAVLLESGEPERAISDLDEAIRLDPRYAWAYARRGRAYAAKKDYDHAIADYDEAIRLDSADAASYFNRGAAHFARGEHRCAISDYGEAIRLAPGSAAAYFNRGVAHFSEKDYDRAVADFGQAIQLRPKDGTAYFNRGAARRARGDPLGAAGDQVRARLLFISAAISRQVTAISAAMGAPIRALASIARRGDSGTKMGS